MATNNGQNTWGFWIAVKDEASAISAISLTGLLTFLCGVNLLLSALLLFSTSGINLITGVLFGLSVLCFFLGLKLKRGNSRYFIFAAIIVGISLLISLYTSSNFLFAVISILYFILLISGIRGWLFLKRNQAS